jgi:GTPase involved in cell partitioning and DNA repair
LEKEKARYQQDLENFKAKLDRDSERAAQTLREKLSLYKEVANPIIDLIVLAKVDSTADAQILREFEIKRLATTAQLGMFAAVSVYEAYNKVIDYLFDCLEQKRQYAFPEFRTLAHNLLSEMRKDIGIFNDDLVYRGNR